MRRVIFAIASTITGLTLLLSFKTEARSPLAGAAARPSVATPSATASASSAGTSTAATPSATASASSAGTSSGSSSPARKTVTGAAAETRYGPVQVQITVAAGKLTGVTALEYPENDPRDAQINSYAIPQLNSEVLAARSADIDMVSGATYTSDGYLTSLQSALDQAGLA